MEIEGITNLIWLLLGGAAFFLVIRALEARSANGKAPPPTADIVRADPASESESCVRDPVCGMCADPGTDITWIHGERVYYFCSMSCRARFRCAPEKFLRPVLSMIQRASETHAKS